MDMISSISSALSNFSMNKVGFGIGTAVLKKALDGAESEGEGVIKLLELSADPDLGAHFDATA
ncbi:YjfB family protein [Oribacterium sp. WCC10]|uniref:YjfB family protein n=1 Tax=Oribacterium sp. WCC10 TaxID=1855343 RepID=UPI0008EA4E08|nr:YjfB family protein [Oribacterium sp. WCC10]SFG51206.1 Putative motility protein [Oribacterium sp. WCC10]